MTLPEIATTRRVKCESCPLRKLEQFRDFDSKELEIVSSFKTGELSADKGATILREGAHSAHLFTVLSGWGFRYKTLEDGRRQILNLVMPGDLLGLQGSIIGEMQHSIETLSAVTLCVFERDRLFELFKKCPSLAYDVTWLAARQERILDENLLSVGRRSALERSAFLMIYVYRKAKASGLTNGKNDKAIPLTQHHIADTLGLSIVHTNRTLKKLTGKGLIRWLDRGYEVLDEDGLLELSGWDGETTANRPFI